MTRRALVQRPWICGPCRATFRFRFENKRRWFSSCRARHISSGAAGTSRPLNRVRNIGIIAHIDAGKTTTTERMLYYSGFTRRIGDVDDGSTVTDFLPAERARGITIQSAAITFHWPPESTESKSMDAGSSHTINLIDTPGHADFTFEVIRSLRVLDGAICILDGVAGVEAQTEKVWHQANTYNIPRILYVNKLDRDGAAFNKTVKEIASRLHTTPLLCQIPWWKGGEFVGVGDVVNLRGLLWEANGDGRTIETFEMSRLKEEQPDFASELLKAREALIESLTEHDEDMVEAFFDVDSEYSDVPGIAIVKSLRKCQLTTKQAVTPVYAGASFKNIGVQPLLDAVNDLLPSPPEALDPLVSLEDHKTSMSALLDGNLPTTMTTKSSSSAPKAKRGSPATTSAVDKLTACALAFKVVTDARRGVLVYVRVYSGAITRNSLVYNTNLAVGERAQRLLRMYANDAVEIDSIEEGQIGVITGLRYARTGDTLLVYSGASQKNGPPPPINTLQLQPIDVPPPLFFTCVEPNSLAEEKTLADTMQLLLREDPSLSVTVDAESGQTLMAGMGELHLEIARGRLLDDFKVKASMGEIQIGYREVVNALSDEQTCVFDREIAGKKAEASCTASVEPHPTTIDEVDEDSRAFELPDNNRLTVFHPTLDSDGKATTENGMSMPFDLPLTTVIDSLKNGAIAALARGPTHRFPIHSTHIRIIFDPAQHLTPTSTPAALSSASRLAVRAALESSASKNPPSMMEPVMLATIAVTDETLGAVIHDLNAARGAQVLSLDADDDIEGQNQDTLTRRLTPAQLQRVYAPPDPFGGSSSSGDGSLVAQTRQIRARVPLKEMVGYLKHLRSLTGGRGTFVMSVDKFEKMTSERMKKALSELRAGVY